MNSGRQLLPGSSVFEKSLKPLPGDEMKNLKDPEDMN
jgi:hypothetical protein